MSMWFLGVVMSTACAGRAELDTMPTPVAAQDRSVASGQDVPDVTPGILVMAHGGSDEWNASVKAAVAPLSEEVPTAIAFGMARRETLDAAVRELEARGVDRIAVVRLFVSGDSFLASTEYLFGHRAQAPAWLERGGSTPLPLEFSSQVAIDREGLVDGFETEAILLRRVLELSTDPTSEVVLVLGHGNGDEAVNDRLLETMDARAAPIRKAGFRAVVVETLREDWKEARREAEPRIRSWVRDHVAAGRRVIVVPLRLSGFGPYAEVLEGLDYLASGVGLLPAAEITSWVRRRARVTFCANSWESRALPCPVVTTR